jgi:hypothetical protein
MPAEKRFVMILAAALPLLTSCSPNPPLPSTRPDPQPITTTPTPVQPVKSTCDCSVFPPARGCDSQCGITTGTIESVTSNSVTLSIPSITVSPAGKKSTQIAERTFAIAPAEARQLQSIGTGSHVALTFHSENGLNAVKSIRQITPESVKPNP